MNQLVVADDLTGALEIAALSEDTVVHWRGGVDDADSSVVVNLGTRDLSPDRWTAVMTQWNPWWPDPLPLRIGQKIDSLGRGHWIEELVYWSDRFERRHVLVAPALPSQGRTTRDGVILDQERPVLNVLDQLQAYGISAVRWGADDFSPLSEFGERHVVVADAATEGDLARLIDAWPYSDEETLFVGSRGLISAWVDSRLPSPKPWSVAGNILIVVGSLRAHQQGQLEALADVAPVGHLEAVDDWRQLAGAGGDLIVTSVYAQGLARGTLARLWKQAFIPLCQRPWGAVVATGGATAEWMLEAAAARRLRPLAAMVHGSVLARIEGGFLDQTLLVTKSGSFGGTRALRELYNMLDAKRNGEF